MNTTNTFAPLVIFTYNRPRHTQSLLDSLSNLEESYATDLYIFSDGAKREADTKTVNETRDVLKRYADSTKFKSIHLVEMQHNMGLAQSIINGVTEVISKYGKAIVLEDDLVVSEDFLHYMNAALDYYEKDNRIWSVSGYSFPIDIIKKDVYFTGRACSWGWATWKDRWSMVDWETNDYKSFRYSLTKRIDFGKWGADMPDMLDRCILGDINSWAIRWCYSAWKNNMLTVYPRLSHIRNTGTDGSGTNFDKDEHKYDTAITDSRKQTEFVPPYIQEDIRKEFRNRYVNPLIWIKIQVRALINIFRPLR